MEEPPEGQTRNEMDSARIEGNALQARDIYGDVNIPARPSRREPPHQLLADAAFFINHQHHLDELDALTSAGDEADGTRADPRLVPVVVIVGPGGVGKTTLATRWARRVCDQFRDGQLFADLRGSSEEPPAGPGTVLGGFLTELGVPPELVPADTDLRSAMFRSEVAGRKVLIMLDNAASAAQVRPLLPGDRGPVVIVTSRNRLSGLAVHHDVRHIRLDIFQKDHAVALLEKVTGAEGRQDDGEELAQLAELCARLPLALRITAERIISEPELRLADLMADLRDDTTLWETLSTDEGEAVKGVFSWSYRHLPPDAAAMFRALGLHRGPDFSPAVASAAVGGPADAARRALGVLKRAFLIDSVRPGRYRQHNLLRAYAREQAGAMDSGEDRRETISRIVRWYTATALNASRVLLPGREFPLGAAVSTADGAEFQTPKAAYEWFDAERPNLVANAGSAMEAGLPRRAWELAMALSPLHASYLTFDDWSVLSELAVTAAGQMNDTEALASALDNRGRFLFRSGNLREARAAHSRALEIQEGTGDQPGICRSLNALGLVCLQARDLTDAVAYFTATIGKAAGQPRWHGAASVNLAHALLESGREAEALELLTPLPRFFAEHGDQLNVGTSRQLIAWANRLLGDYDRARDAIDAALRIAEDAGNRAWEANWLIEAARVSLALDDTAEATRRCQRAVSLQRKLRDPGREAAALDCTGEVLLAGGNAEDASAFCREAARIHHQLDSDWPEGLALTHLADCEAALGHGDAARERAAEALGLIERFTDPRAVKISANLRRYLA